MQIDITQTFNYHIEKFESMAPNLVQILLQPQGPANLDYLAGQYLEMLYPDGSWQPFSFANAPDNNDRIELHIRHLSSDRLTIALLQQLQNLKQVTIRGPYGHAHYRTTPNFPIILVAGGTGFAYTKAIIEAAIHNSDKRALHLFWGVKNSEDFYLPELLPLWHEQLTQFRHTLIISQPQNSAWQNNVWHGKKGYVYNAVIAEYADLSAFQVYASGPAQMIRDTFNWFKQYGLKPELMFSDML